MSKIKCSSLNIKFYSIAFNPFSPSKKNLLAFLYWLNALNVSLTLSTNQFIQLWKIWICFCRLRMIIERRTSKRNEPVAVIHIERRIDVSLLKLLLPVIVIETVCLSLLCHSDWADASNPKLYAIKKNKNYTRSNRLICE
jgi:hypothetical protein